MNPGLIFDVDGVIVDSEPVNARASIRVLAERCGIAGVGRDDFEAGLGRGARAYLVAAATAHGVELEPAVLDEAVALRERGILDLIRSEGLPVHPGVHALMAAARADGFALAIASSAARELVEAMLAAGGVDRAGMAFVCGDMVSRRKPDPELFLTAANLLELAPARCVVVEDAPDGVAAARAAGCRCLAVTNSVPAKALAAADRVVASLATVGPADLRALLDAAG